MKKAIILLVAILIFSSCSFGGNNIQMQSPSEPLSAAEYESIRDFCISAEGAKAMAEAADLADAQCEICALYEDIATFKLSRNDEPAEFYTVKINSGDSYSFEIISHRTFKEFEGESFCEFFPHAEDGYPESAFIPIDVYEFIPKNIASAKKVYYVVSEIGSGKYFTEPEQINNLISSLSDMKVYPIERFLTSNEILLGIELSSNVMQFYKSAEDEEPFCKIYLDMIYSQEKESSRTYYPVDVSPAYQAYKNAESEFERENVSSADPESVLEEYGAEMLLHGTWNNAKDLRVDWLVMWFGYRVRDSVNVSDYRRDGKDGLYFPEDEFEKLVYNYFGLTPEHLRKSETYNAEEKAYVTPTALYDLAETEYAITKTDYEGDEMKIYFDLKIADKDPVSRILAVDTQNGGMRFVSCK